MWPWTRPSVPLPERRRDGSAWPLVSIVMPSFNQGPYLEQALRSVLLQGYPRLELIVVDGGSTDDSLAVLSRYEPWLKQWVSAPDSGPADALNTGFGFASGDVFGVLNADDFYLPGCLARVIEEFAAHPSVDVVSGHGYFAKPSGELGVPTFSDRWNSRRFRYGTCVLVQQSTFFRRQAFERTAGFQRENRMCWDMELWADMAATGARFHAMNAFVAAFRLHAQSISGRPDLRPSRRQTAHAVRARVAGRPASAFYHACHYWHRLLKFSRHPARTLRQRVFFYSTLKRWSI